MSALIPVAVHSSVPKRRRLMNSLYDSNVKAVDQPVSRSREGVAVDAILGDLDKDH